ncbi:MAG: hypothetical protein AAGA21_19535 [Pseudomonadota bacterium]
MSGERYVGERSALWHFLSELRPLVVDALGEDALLRHQIDRALKTSDLETLRQARRVFHHHPDELKRRLMRGIFDSTSAGGEVPRMPPATAPAIRTEGKEAAVIRFDAFPAASEKDVALSVELGLDRPGEAPVKVTIKPGTLPRSAAEALRQVADWIEHDRHILSSRHWSETESSGAKADETIDKV